MAKILTDKELLDIVKRTIEGDEIDDQDQYMVFLDQLSRLITDNFGGNYGQVNWDATDELGYTVAITQDGNIPEDGGIYAKYDTEGEL